MVEQFGLGSVLMTEKRRMVCWDVLVGLFGLVGGDG